MAITDTLSRLAQTFSNPGDTDIEAGEMFDMVGENLGSASRANVIDLSDRLSNRTNIASGEKFKKTNMTKFQEFIRNPNVIKGLATFGQAFAGGRPDEPGTILGQYAIGAVNDNAERAVMGRILSGGSIEDVPPEMLNALTPESMARVASISGSREDSRRADEALALRQDVAGFDQDMQERVLSLRRQGVSLDYLKFFEDKEQQADLMEFKERQFELEKASSEALQAYREGILEVQRLRANGESVDQNSLAIRRQNFMQVTMAQQDLLQQEAAMVESEIKSKLSQVEGGDPNFLWRSLIGGMSPGFGMASQAAAAGNRAEQMQELGIPELKDEYERLMGRISVKQNTVEQLNNQLEGFFGIEQEGGTTTQDTQSTEGAQTENVGGEGEQAPLPQVYSTTPEEIAEIGDEDMLVARDKEELDALRAAGNTGAYVSYRGGIVRIGE